MPIVAAVYINPGNQSGAGHLKRAGAKGCLAPTRAAPLCLSEENARLVPTSTDRMPNNVL
jgi:hypothetical protein